MTTGLTLKFFWVVLGLVLLLGFGVNGLAMLYVEASWASSLGYLPSFWIRVGMQIGLAGFSFFGVFFLLRWHLTQVWTSQREPILSLLLLPVSAGVAYGLSRESWLLLCFVRQVPFGIQDPIFHLDLGFYIFTLPFLKEIQFWGISLAGTLLGVMVLAHAIKLWVVLPVPHQVLDPALILNRRLAQRHLLSLLGIVFLLLAAKHALTLYQVVLEPRGSVFGASYTDIHTQIPGHFLLIGIALLTAGIFFGSSIYLDSLFWRGIVLKPLILCCAYGCSVLVVHQILPVGVQYFVVAPNELERELPYLGYNIQFTRKAFDLETIETKLFKDNGSIAEYALTAEDLINNEATIKNIRLWDADPLLTTYRQLQEIRPYYQFPSLDVDRYSINGELRQVMHSLRELNYDQVPQSAKTWVNKRFFFTHGYGLALSPVNVVTKEGLPDFFIANIPPEASNDVISQIFKIQDPAIYFGELTNTDVFVGGKTQELDYSQDDRYVYSAYQGSTGIPVQNGWQRWLYAFAFKDINILITHQITPETQLLFRRRIQDRVHHLTPFLTYDQDPYLIIVNGKLYWLLDAYTTSRNYPYSTIISGINYIRNSVKVLVDVYDGSVNFYISDTQDPLIQTYQRILPNLFKPLEDMPASIRHHIRYPVDLFKIQAEQFSVYHMTDPATFYNREDQWQIAEQTRNNKIQRLEPQYHILTLPNIDSKTPEFVLLLPFTPLNKQNLIAWMAARCDGDHYGKRFIYQFPQERLFFGPQQVEARIHQNPDISEQISLWNEHGSRVKQGDVQVIPMDDSLLYIQPLYLEAEEVSVPQLTRVLAISQDKVVMKSTLMDALQTLVSSEQR
jgi:uncharacterized membrane protein (UPF0182 family)